MSSDPYTRIVQGRVSSANLISKLSNNPLNSSADSDRTDQKKNNYAQDYKVNLTEEAWNEDNLTKGELEVEKILDTSIKIRDKKKYEHSKGHTTGHIKTIMDHIQQLENMIT
ncbi:hypothetical protein CHS0354_017391 [Potamilus streckersoni]|uniref:Uncharacterized protein n=1 Tax=Potamilus streckersoni TaxID=2493646 RepID=A0AAE0T4X5_9BIVA|nr:hypothetical protein CHS0354_017391 [Potamilus streckersoni]